jgi:ABC-2 type transport system permease protein
MIGDILTVMWKEKKSLFQIRGSRMRFLMVLASPVLLATVLPLTWGPEWLEQVPPLAISALVAVILVMMLIPESIAGERERHTMGTLLASRLPDRAILFGKLIPAIGVAWGTAILAVILSLVTTNIAHGQGELLFFTAPIALGSLAISLLMAILTAGLGVFVSLRAATSQEASQILMALILVPAMVLQVIPLLFRDQMGRVIESIDGPQVLAIILAFLLLADIAVMLAAVIRFQRSRLSLD